MTWHQKIVKSKLGLLELGKQLGNVAEACRIMGYSRDSAYGQVRISNELKKEGLFISPGGGRCVRLAEHNENWPHTGRWCYGKTPMETFKESVHIAREKMVGYEEQVSDDALPVRKQE